ncbi:hypothetical protein [Pedobacter sp. Hv1]|uniref:hypothetical protein n=1 Tax=Pedobacter sp. Hv1 TaxID=1740090 RepID=UPI0006D8B3C9|nr:hypothetical protein [Pedobacter sp. Hv1]KQC00829.1 hypothetical protein AQF98_09120 [Pedobacter sp. Hv1]
MGAAIEFPEGQNERIADTLLLELDPVYHKLKVGFGESFYLHDQKLWMNETPLSDPSLVPIQNVSISEGKLKFTACFQKGNQRLSITPEYKGVEAMLEMIKSIHQNGLSVDKQFSDEVNILLESDGLTLRLINPSANQRILITLSEKHGNVFLRRYPEPSLRLPIEALTVSDKVLRIKCIHVDQSDLGDLLNQDLEYNWEFNVQPDFLEGIIGLIQAGITYSFRQ